MRRTSRAGLAGTYLPSNVNRGCATRRNLSSPPDMPQQSQARTSPCPSHLDHAPFLARATRPARSGTEKSTSRSSRVQTRQGSRDNSPPRGAREPGQDQLQSALVGHQHRTFALALARVSRPLTRRPSCQLSKRSFCAGAIQASKAAHVDGVGARASAVVSRRISAPTHCADTASCSPSVAHRCRPTNLAPRRPQCAFLRQSAVIDAAADLPGRRVLFKHIRGAPKLARPLEHELRIDGAHPAAP